MTHSKTPDWSVTLTPHRSLSRQGFLIVMGVIAAFNFIVGFVFWSIGAWPIVGFLGFDVLAMWLAFRWNFADSRKRERIVATGDAIELIREAEGTAPVKTMFNRRWVKVELVHDEARELVGPLYLRSHGQRHEIASFLGADERESLARALRRAL